MKSNILKAITLLAIPFTSIGQSYHSLNFNNCNVNISNQGAIINQTDNTWGMQIGDNPLILNSVISLNAKNANNQVVGSVYSDFSAGPNSTGDAQSNFDAYEGYIHNVRASEIVDYLNGNVSANGLNKILGWPANGNDYPNTPHFLAPYFDYNSNGSYEAGLDLDTRDYPCIKGDEATYVILNDGNFSAQSTVFGGISMGVEIHIMSYQYGTGDANNRTTFFDVTVINRSIKDYYDVNLGVITDFDIGNPFDDYIGSDSSRNILYGYNGDMNDEAYLSNPGYGGNAPAAGIILLSSDAYTINAFLHTPQLPSQFTNVANGLNFDGSHLTNSAGFPTNFSFNSTQVSGDTEANNFHIPGDRRGLISAKFDELLSGDTIKSTYAVLYDFADDMQTNFSPVEKLLASADIVRQKYLEIAAESTCENSIAAIQENKISIGLYPNPAINEVNIQMEGTFDAKLIDTRGRLVLNKQNCFNQQKLALNGIDKGIYFIRVKTEKGIQSEKLIIE